MSIGSLMVAGFVVSALVPARSAAQDPPRPDGKKPCEVVIEGEGFPAERREEAVGIMRELERWRGLRFREDVRIEAVDAAEGERRGGWYDPVARRLVVVRKGSERFQRGALLHELHHALQDQHFELAELHRRAVDADMDAAIRALIEGEAMLAVAELLAYDFARHAKLPEAGVVENERFRKNFEYGAGMQFVRTLRERGGWAEVDRAYRNPPRATAEIYHPERHPSLSGKPVADPELELPEDALVRRRWNPGEYGLRSLLVREPATRASQDLASDLVRAIAVTLNDPAREDGTIEIWSLALRDTSAAARLEEALRKLDRVSQLERSGAALRFRLHER